MSPRGRAGFALLIAAQAAHSVEEYHYRLFDVFSPARFVSSLVSSDLAAGFAVVNIAIVAFGVWCYWARIRTWQPRSRAYAWFWTYVEFANGVGHLILAGVRGGYFSGAATAPLLIVSAGYLGSRLLSPREA